MTTAPQDQMSVPVEDADVLALAAGLRLTAKKRRFCWEYSFGEYPGNATRSYMIAYANPNEGTASTGADALLKDPVVQAFLGALRQQALDRVSLRLQPWGDLVEEAQATVLAVMRGYLRSRLMLDAANSVLDRALGRPPQRLEHELVRDEARVRRALAAHAKRTEATGEAFARPDLFPEHGRVPAGSRTIPAQARPQRQLPAKPDTVKGAS